MVGLINAVGMSTFSIVHMAGSCLQYKTLCPAEAQYMKFICPLFQKNPEDYQQTNRNRSCIGGTFQTQPKEQKKHFNLFCVYCFKKCLQ